MTPPSGASRSVLVANLATDVRERFTAGLRAAGHEVLGAASLSELVAHLRSPTVAVDLVALDLALSSAGVSGVQTIRAAHPTVPIIVFAGSIADAQEIRALHELGINAYINEHCAVHHILPALAPLLFPENFNRRISTRITLDIAVSYQHDDTIATALSLNLSKGGLGVRTMTPLARATKVIARFRLPGSQHEVNAACRVAWSDHRSGMGLQFEDVDADDQSAIDEFVDHHVADDPGKTPR